MYICHNYAILSLSEKTFSLGNHACFSHHQHSWHMQDTLCRYYTPSVIEIWYLSLPTVNLTVGVHYFVVVQT